VNISPKQALLGRIHQDTQLVNHINQLERDVAFYKRLLVQACLSNSGKIDIDPSKAVETVFGEFTLEFGSGKITLLGSEHSLFPEVTHES
jgi:hypothetical protein